MMSAAREKSIEVTAEDAAALAAKSFGSPTASNNSNRTTATSATSTSSSGGGGGSVKKRISNLIKLRPQKTNKTSPSTSTSGAIAIGTTPSLVATPTTASFRSSGDSTTASEISSRPYYAPNILMQSSSSNIMNDVDNSSFNSESMGQMSIAPTVSSLDTVKASNRQHVQEAILEGSATPYKNKSPWKKLKQFMGIPPSNNKHNADDPALDDPIPMQRSQSAAVDYYSHDNSNNTNSNAGPGPPTSLTSPSRRRIASLDFPPSKTHSSNKQQQAQQQQQQQQQQINKQQQQAMLDDAVRGRLDGMDYLSLGPANLISLERQASPSKSEASCTPWEPAPTYSFAGRSTHYSTKQMVTDMMWKATGGRKAPEIVLEGFFRDDRWIVTLDLPTSSSSPSQQQNNNHNTQTPQAQSTPNTTTSTTPSNSGNANNNNNNATTTAVANTSIDVDDTSNWYFCNVDHHYNSPDHEQQRNSPEALPTLQLTDEEDHSHSTTEEIIPRHKLWGSMWGSENKPPPKPSLMSSVEDIDPSGDNILEMAASCSVPIDVDEDTFMISNAQHLQAVHDLASVPLQHGRFEDAMIIFRKLLRGIQIQEEDPLRHLEGVTLHNMTVVLMWQDKYEEALETVGKAIQARLQYLPEKHPDIAVSLVRQGYAYFALEKFDLAEASLAAALDIFVDCNILKAKVLSNLGVVQYQRGDDSGALKNFHEALEIQRLWLQGAVRREANVFGAAVILGNMGKIHIKRGDYDLAVSVYEEALLLQTSIFRSDDENVLDCLVSLALAWAFNAQPQKAVQILNGVLRSQISRYGPGTAAAVETTGTIGFLHFGLGNYEDALKCCAPVLKWQKANLEPGHPALRKTKDIMKRIKKSVQAVWV